MKKLGRVLKKIETINGSEKIEYGKDFKEIKFNSDDSVPLNRLLKCHNITIIIRCVFSEDDKFYPQLFLDDALYQLQKCYDIKKLMLQKELI